MTADDTYRQSIRINPKDANIWHILGTAYKNLIRYNDAIGAYRQALRIDPVKANTWYFLGSAYSNLKRYSRHIQHYKPYSLILMDAAECRLVGVTSDSAGFFDIEKLES